MGWTGGTANEHEKKEPAGSRRYIGRYTGRYTGRYVGARFSRTISGLVVGRWRYI